MRLVDVIEELRREYLGDSVEVQEAKRIARDALGTFEHIVKITEHTDVYDSADCEDAFDNVFDAIVRWKVRNGVKTVEDEIW